MISELYKQIENSKAHRKSQNERCFEENIEKDLNLKQYLCPTTQEQHELFLIRF